MLVARQYTTELGKPNHFHGFVAVVLNEQTPYVAEAEPIVGPVYLLEGENIWGKNSWIVNSQIDLET